MLDIAWLDPRQRDWFPDVNQALRDPNGLLAAGGDLSPERLMYAYQHGIFPWYSEGQPVLWWSPDPRLVLYPQELHVSRNLAKTIRQERFEISLDRAFTEVVKQCAAPRSDQPGTWITEEMFYAYTRLHELGWAHSIECWQDGQLAGGLYGVASGKVFFGESMFATVTDASKIAFVHFVHQLIGKDFRLIDCQVETQHLCRFGARPISRQAFVRELENFAGDGFPENAQPGWQLDMDIFKQVTLTGGKL